MKFFEVHSSSAYMTMFFFSATVGYFFCGMWAVAFTCWLKEFDQFAPTEISQGNSLHVIGSQVVLAITFQFQTLSMDAIKKASIGEIPKAFCIAAAIFGTLIFLVVICNYLCIKTCSIDMSKFGWPITFPYNFVAIKVVAKLMKSSVDSILNTFFNMFHVKALMQTLTDDTLSDGGGAMSSPSFTLNYSNFVHFLKDFETKEHRL